MNPDIGLVKRHGDAVHSPITDVWECTALGLIAENELFLRDEEFRGTPGVEKSGESVCIGEEILSFDGRLRYAYPNENLVRGEGASPHLAPYNYWLT